jgi:uncharacterized protein YndB with AHSA1/START domain
MADENDFEAVVGHKQFTPPKPGWNCEVLEVDEPRKLVYSWGDGTESDSGLKTIVTWTLTTAAGGTLVRMEQSGFKPADEGGFKAMGGGWPPILGALERATGMFP